MEIMIEFRTEYNKYYTVKDFSRWVKRNIFGNPALKEGIHYINKPIEHNNAAKLTGNHYTIKYNIFVTEEVCEMLLASKRGSNKLLQPTVLLKPEVEFGRMLEVNIDYNIIPQYTVLNYRLDFYIPEFNIAVEFDELGHQDYNDDFTRENNIKNVMKDIIFFRVTSFDNFEEKIIELRNIIRLKKGLNIIKY